MSARNRSPWVSPLQNHFQRWVLAYASKGRRIPPAATSPLKTAPVQLAKRPSCIGQPAVPPDSLWGYVTIRKPWCRGAGVCWNGAMRKLPVLHNLYFREHFRSVPPSPRRKGQAPSISYLALNGRCFLEVPKLRDTVMSSPELCRSRCNLESWQRSRFARTSNVRILAIYFMCCVGALLLRSCCELVVSLERDPLSNPSLQVC